MNKGIFRFQVFRRRRAACKLVATISAFAMLCVASLPAFAGESLLGGNAVLEKLTRVTMSENTADALTFESSSPVGVLDWTKFNIGLNQRMSFNGAASTFFNLVDGAAGKSQIDGMINGTAGGVWVINPSGVAFGANAIVNLEGVFAAAAGTVNNADDLRDGSATTPTFGSFGGAVDVGASTFTADRIALLGKSVSVDGANFKSVGSVSIGAADKMAVVDDVAGGKVTINISDFTDDTDVLKDIAVDLGDVDFGDTGHAGDLTVVTEGSISVKGAVKAEGDIVFKTLAAEGASAPVISYKQMSVASGKLLQGKSASATAAGRVAVDGDVTATGGDVEVTAGSYVNVGTAATVESKTGDVTINAVGNVNMGGTVAAAESVVLKATGGADETAKSVKVGFDGSSYNPNASVSGKNVTMEGKMSSQVLAGSVAATESVTMSGGEYVAVNGAVSGKGVTLETTDRATLSKDHSELGLKKDDPAGILVTDDGSVTAVDSLAMTSKGIISADGVVKVTSESAKVSLGAEGGEIAFSNDGNVIKGTVDVTGGNVDIKGDSNDFDYGKVAADGSGNITLQGNGKDVTIKDSVEASGTFTVNDAEDIALKDDVQVGAAVLTASKTIEQDTGKKLEAKDGITLTAGEGVTLKGSVNADTDGENGGNLVVMKNDTDNGDLLQDGGEIRANELTAAEFTQTGDGKLYANVINADVQQNGCEIVDNGDKTITVNGDFTQADGTLGASDTVQITINGVLEQNAVNSDPDRALIQADEVILNDAATQGGELAGDTIKAMTLTVNAEGKDISLASAANEVGALQGKGDDVSVTTSTALDLGALEAESLTVRAGGSVSQPGSAVVEGLVDITAEYSDGSGANVALLGTENQFGSVKVKGSKIEIKEKDDVVIAGIDGMILYVEAGPSGDPVEYTKTITQNETGDIKTSDGARFYGSSVKLDNDGNAIGPHFSARADNGDVEIVNNAPIGIENDAYTDVTGVTASGAVKLTAKAGDITMYNGAELSGASIDLTAETGNISLDSGKVLVTAADGAATFSAENGAISAQNADNDFKSVMATAKSVAFFDKDDVTVAQATATEGNVVMTAGAKMRVKGDITGESVDLDAGDFVNVAAGKTVKATSGAVDIEAAGNADVIGSVVAESGAVSVKATGAGKSVRVAGTVGGKTGVSLEGDKSVQIGGEVASSDGDVTATAKEFVAIDGGSVTAAKGTATLKTTDAELLTAGGGAATYEAGQLAGVMVGGAAAGTVAAKDVVIESAGSVLVNSGSTVTATAVEEAGGTVAVTANGETEATVATSGITKQGVYVLGTVTADGTLDVTAKGEGGILAEGALVADNGETTLTAENGAIDAQNEANDFKSVTATAKSVALNDKDDISVTEVTATDTTDGDVRIRAATGNLTVADATSAKVSGQDIRLEATEGAITVGAGVSGKNVTLVAKGNVTTRKETGVADGALTAAGTGSDLLVESTDRNIELKADATAADTAALLADNGGIHAASVDATAIYAKGKDDVDIDNATGNLITKTGGNVDVEFTDSADHTISYDAEGYVKVSAKGKLTVDSAIAEGEDLKVSEVLWPEDTSDKTLIDHENESTQVGGVRAGTSVELESTESGIKVNTAVAAGTTAELKAKTNVEVDGAVVGETGVTLTATEGDITIGSDTAPGAVVKAGAFEIPTDGSAPVIADGDSANLAMTAGKSVTVQNGAKVGAS
ncbi:MAG: filamentous hemagglutinin N-terminal domain-containing protein, partial [Kiritimatiellae bacterium]|nr:filamentous hemagglutinin N-terminal domain-containing protein [Kiritimatiellia bacterium]